MDDLKEKYLIISDIHGNIHGLNAILVATRDQYDGVLCLGDIVGYGAFPNECCETVQGLIANGGKALMGNHDAAAIGVLDPKWFNPIAYEAIKWTGKTLKGPNKAWLKSLYPDYFGEDFQAVHGSLIEPLTEYINFESTAKATIQEMYGHVCFYGHTHTAEVWAEDKDGKIIHTPYLHGGSIDLQLHPKHLINPGSCGQPRDGNPYARAAIWNTKTKVVDIIEVEYDVEAAKASIIYFELPERLGERLVEGR